MAAGTFAATVVLGFLVVPRDSSDWWLHGLFFDDSRTGFVGWGGNQSLRAILTRFAGSIDGATGAWVIAALLAAVIGLASAVLLDRAGHAMLAILATALVGLLDSPISWDHHWVWIALAVVVAAHYAISATRRGAKGTARWLWLAVAGMIFTYAAWPDALFTHARNLGKFSLGLLWLQKNTSPIVFSKNNDQPWYVEYHWHGFQLLWGNTYILAGVALLLIALWTGFRLRNRPAAAEVAEQEPLTATIS